MNKIVVSLSVIIFLIATSQLIGMGNSRFAAPPQKLGIEGDSIPEGAMVFVNPTLEIAEKFRPRVFAWSLDLNPETKEQTYNLIDAIIKALALKSDREKVAPVLENIINGIPNFTWKYIALEANQIPQWATSTERPNNLGGFLVIDETIHYKNALLASLKQPMLKRPLKS